MAEVAALRTGVVLEAIDGGFPAEVATLLGMFSAELVMERLEVLQGMIVHSHSCAAATQDITHGSTSCRLVMVDVGNCGKDHDTVQGSM